MCRCSFLTKLVTIWQLSWTSFCLGSYATRAQKGMRGQASATGTTDQGECLIYQKQHSDMHFTYQWHCCKTTYAVLATDSFKCKSRCTVEGWSLTEAASCVSLASALLSYFKCFIIVVGFLIYTYRYIDI